MPKVITATSLIMFWVFYEMSGGADFEPRQRVVETAAPFEVAQAPDPAPAPAEPATTPVVTNVALTSATTPAPVVAPAPVAITLPVAEPEPVAAPEPEVTLVYVSGNRVNLRRGPGTNHPVVDTVPQGTEAELIASNDIGWARIRLTETGQIGWMSERLLADG